MQFSLIINSIMYIILTLMTTYGIKYTQYHYNYDSYWIIIFYINVCFPVNLIMYIYKFSLVKLLKQTLLVKKLFVPSIIYSLETGLLFWCLTRIPLNFYVIGRTSSAYFNVYFSYYYLKNKVYLMYFIGLVILTFAYILLALNIDTVKHDALTIIAMLIVLASGFTTSLYSNMTEKHLKECEENKLELQLAYQLFGNFYAFIIFVPMSISLGHRLFNDNVAPNVILLISGLAYQIFFLFRLFIIGSTHIAGNHVVSGLDLFRRVISNILAYATLYEAYNNEIISSNICMFIGSLFLIASQFKKNIYNKLVSIELENIEI